MAAPRIVLIHSPFVGPSSWAHVAEALRRRGWPAATPTMPSWDDISPPYYERLARHLAASLDVDEPLVLVGHSGAGGLLPLVAEAARPQVRAVVFVDAILPHPGRSWIDTTPAGLADRLRRQTVGDRLPSWSDWFEPAVFRRLLPDPAARKAFTSELRPVPTVYAAEIAPTCPHWPPARVGYLQLSEGYAEEAEAAKAAGWILRRDIIHHLATVTDVDRVSESLEALIQALAGST